MDSECPTLITQVESPSLSHPWTDVLTAKQEHFFKGCADPLLLTPGTSETGMLLTGSSPEALPATRTAFDTGWAVCRHRLQPEATSVFRKDGAS